MFTKNGQTPILQEQTVAVIKPEMQDCKSEIMERIKEAGIVVQAEKTVTLSRDEAGTFYSEHKEKEFYGDLCDYMARSVYSSWNLGVI